MPKKYWLRYQSLAPFDLDDPWIDESVVTAETEEEAQRIADRKSKETGRHYSVKSVE